MKKFLSISVCLMLCLTTFMFFGCEEKPTNIGEVEAAQVLNTAMANMETANAIKMSSDGYEIEGETMGKFLFVLTENISYSEMNMFGVDAISWVKQEGNNWYKYSILPDVFGDTGEVEYVKSLVLSEDGQDEEGNPFDMLLENFEDSEFAKATKLKGEFSISFKVVEEDVTTTLTFKVKDETLKSFKVSAGEYSMTIDFEYGEAVLEDIPEIPTNVEWYVCEPKIEVDGMPTEFVVGETLDLFGVTLEYYEDGEESFADYYDITIDMISGFDTTTATEEGQPRTMTVTFYGLTFDIEYTVVEAPVAE